MYTFLREWPTVLREARDIERLYGHSPLGLDLEYDSKARPTILGLSDGKTTVSVPFDSGLPYFLTLLEKNPRTVFVGHNVIGADRSVLAKYGIDIPLDSFEDTIIRHWLVNMHLSKSSGKAALEEDEDERRGRGFNNLGSMASLYTDLPHWKDCREPFCSGPCPIHDPYGYNGIDSLAPVQALPKLKTSMALRGLEKLYPFHRELADALAEIRDYGVQIDRPYIEQLRSDFEREKEEAAKLLPFNARSPKDVLAYFNDKGARRLEDPNGKLLYLENSQEETIRTLIDKLGGEEFAPDELIDLLDFKELGNGPDRWFADQYVDPKTGYIKGYMDPAGFVHPHLGYFTSSARLMCSSPNFQNVAKRRVSRKVCTCGHLRVDHAGVRCAKCTGEVCMFFRGESVGKKIRRAIIAPEGMYIVRADYSNGENRVYLYLAGYEAPTTDLHQWMVTNIGLKETDEFSVRMGSARDASKSVTHAADYCEGLQLKLPSELRAAKIKKEISVGARIVFPDWTFRGRVVTFTGINLARRAFGKATLENRAAANNIVSRYIDKTFPKIRDLQRRISKQVEVEGMVRPPHGYVLVSYGDDHDRLKTAMAVWGSQPLAHISKVALLGTWKNFKKGRDLRPVLQVHDELLAYTSNETNPTEAMSWLKSDMEIETKEMPGFKIPVEASYGPNWRDQTKEKKA